MIFFTAPLTQWNNTHLIQCFLIFSTWIGLFNLSMFLLFTRSRTGLTQTSENARTVINNVSESLPIPMILLKLPRSGSSWLTELLNNLDVTIDNRHITSAKRAGVSLSHNSNTRNSWKTLSKGIDNHFKHIPNVFLTKEIIQQNTVNQFYQYNASSSSPRSLQSPSLPYSRLISHLLRALKIPSAKFSMSNKTVFAWSWLSGRFREDYLLNLKVSCNSMRLL